MREAIYELPQHIPSHDEQPKAFPSAEEQRRMFHFSASSQHSTRCSSQNDWARTRNKNTQIGGGKKVSLFTDDIILHVKKF